MNCFECGSKCVTQYHCNNVVLGASDWQAGMKVTHVNKACINCNWQSFKTKVPQKLP